MRKALNNCQNMLSDHQLVFLPTLNDFLSTLNDFLPMLNDFLPTQNVCMSLLSDLQLVFLPTPNVCMFTLHDLLKAYSIIWGKETSPQHMQRHIHAHTMEYALACLHASGINNYKLSNNTYVQDNRHHGVVTWSSTWERVTGKWPPS